MEPRLVFPVHNRETAAQVARIRSVLGLATGSLPAVDRRGLCKYYGYLSARLSFPFQARFAGDGPPPSGSASTVTVLALLDPREHPGDEYAGLVCRVTQDVRERELPLVDLEVDDEHPDFQLLEDYWYWVWNWRFDPQI
jgi:hypothetical protein